MISFVPAPIAAPVSELTSVFVAVLGFVTTGLTTEVGVVFVVITGFVVVTGFVVTTGLVVTVGLTAGVVTLGVVVFVVGVVVLDVSVDLVGKRVFGASVVLGTMLVFVVKDAGGFVGKVAFCAGGKVSLFVGLVTVEVTGGGLAPPPIGVVPVFRLERVPEPSEVIEPEVRPVNEGRSFKLLMTLFSGATSKSLASGSCLVDVRFFKIAIFILPF